jgi:transcription elongation factor Elf1
MENKLNLEGKSKKETETILSTDNSVEITVEKKPLKSVIEIKREKEILKAQNNYNKMVKCSECGSTARLIKFHKKSSDETYICANCSPLYTFNLFKKIDKNVNNRNFKIYENMLKNSLDKNLDLIKGK